jgi:sensor histidine kinase YesM
MIIARIRKAFLKLVSNRTLQHILFWTASFIFLVNFFSTSNRVEKIDYIYTLLFHGSLLAAVYVNIWILIPKVLQKGKYLIYSGCLIALIYLAAHFNQLTFNHLVDLVLPGYYFISYYEITDILKFIFVYVALTSLLKLSKGWFLLSQAEKKLMMIRQEKVESELTALKSQINPHFLFNSLNNIYSLSMGESGKASAAILRLSDLMRYILYESNEEKVLLQKEIAFLENYVDLQRLRSDRHSRITFGLGGAPGELKIAPLLFLPLFENSFKHGIKGDPAGGYVNIRMDIREHGLELSLGNNKGKIDHYGDLGNPGIGLANVQRRLELIYPGKHHLEIDDTGTEFNVKLTLELT